ncbi:MAG: hypothetical protein ACRCSU_06565 [Paracoccaceae bacterium]
MDEAVTVDMNTLHSEAMMPGQLPDAPLAMPKQLLEGPRLSARLAAVGLGFVRRLMPGGAERAGN